jgi:membrane protease YdiL (CAAX protease family)
MDNPPPEAPGGILHLGVALLLTACVALWGQILYRFSRGLPVLPYEPRRPAPWRLIDLVGIFLAYVVLAFSLLFLVERGLGVSVREEAAPAAVAAEKGEGEPLADDQTKDLAHSVIVVLRESPNLATLLFCLLVAAVVAPVAEEIAFRLLFQGWLEAVETHERRWHALWRRLTPGLTPIVVVAAIFAAGHFRTERPTPDIQSLVYTFAIDAAAKILALGVGIWLIWRFRGATAADFGLVPEKLWEDIRLGLLAYVAWVPPVFIIQAIAMSRLPDWVAADPIALFVFALVLGTLYYRTHRIIPAIVTHMGLNTTSLAAAWLLVANQ